VVIVGVRLLEAGIGMALVVEARRDAGLADEDVLALPYARAVDALRPHRVRRFASFAEWNGLSCALKARIGIPRIVPGQDLLLRLSALAAAVEAEALARPACMPAIALGGLPSPMRSAMRPVLFYRSRYASPVDSG